MRAATGGGSARDGGFGPGVGDWEVSERGEREEGVGERGMG